MRRKLIVLAAVFLFAIPHARANEASKRAKVEELLTLEKMDSLMQQMADQALARNKDAVKNMLAGRPMTDIDKRILEENMNKMNAVVGEQLNWQKLKPAYIDLYAAEYSEEEIDGILAFYKSPVGQVMLAKDPELVTKTGEIVSARMQALGPQMQKVIADMRKQYQNAHWK
jgi:hypothetical protein